MHKLHIKHKRGFVLSSGFAIPELIVALVIGSVVVIAASQFTTSIHKTSQQDLDSASSVSKTDSALNLISEEVNQADVILTAQSDLPSGCGYGPGQFFLAAQLPPQAYLKSEYNAQSTSKGVFSKASQNQRLCPIVFGIKASSSSQKGPYFLYRYGPSINEKGFYQDTVVTPASVTSLVEGISNTVAGSIRRCESGWSRIQVRGLEACVDKYNKSALVSVSKEGQTVVGGSSSFKRSGSGTTRGLHSSLIPGLASSSGGTGIGGSTCYLGQCGACDGTTFLIDKSGSMGYRRMQRAKNELLAAVAKCGDGARINVMSFSSNYYSFSSKGNVALNASSRSQINRFIRNIYAGGWTNPWGAMNKLMQDSTVKRVVVLTDGGTNTRGSCIAGGYSDYASCYAKHNITRQNNGLNPVQIDSVALDTSCSYWLGPLSSKNGGSCVRA